MTSCLENSVMSVSDDDMFMFVTVTSNRMSIFLEPICIKNAIILTFKKKLLTYHIWKHIACFLNLLENLVYHSNLDHDITDKTKSLDVDKCILATASGRITKYLLHSYKFKIICYMNDRHIGIISFKQFIFQSSHPMIYCRNNLSLNGSNHSGCF